MVNEDHASTGNMIVVVGAILILVGGIFFFIRDCNQRGQEFQLEKIRLEYQCKDSE